MTEQERKQAFMAALAQLELMYGVTVVSTVSAKQYGAMMQIEPGQPQVVAIENWKPPAPPKEPAE